MFLTLFLFILTSLNANWLTFGIVKGVSMEHFGMKGIDFKKFSANLRYSFFSKHQNEDKIIKLILKK